MNKQKVKFLAVTFIAIAICNCSVILAQTKNENQIIAEGSAKVKVKPDIVILRLSVEKIDTIETKAISDLNIEIEKLTNSLFKLGFTNKLIKIYTYDVSSSITDNQKREYTARNSLVTEFAYNSSLIDAFYNEMQQIAIKDLDISFETKISDSLEKATRTTLVQLSIQNAKSNALNIAKALGVKLSKVKQVLKYTSALLSESSNNIVKFSPPRVVGSTEIIYTKTAFDRFEIQDIELDEKITVIYEIWQSN